MQINRTPGAFQRIGIVRSIAVLAALGLVSGCGAAVTTTPTINGESLMVPRLAHTHTFSFTGKPQTFRVPAGVTKLTIEALGAAGGWGVPRKLVSARGGYVSATIPVKSGEELVIYVGGAGGIASQSAPGLGGYNGGGDGKTSADKKGGAGGGGGASDVRQGGTELRNRVLVGAGGGGAGQSGYYDHAYKTELTGGPGGDGGGIAGATGANGYSFDASQNVDHAWGGGGGTQTAGGKGGAAGGLDSPNPGKAGTHALLGVGGNGGLGGANQLGPGGGGGGGGGGYYGGGGGAGGGIFEDGSQLTLGLGGAGGGGGSSYAETSATNVRIRAAAGKPLANGSVTISW
jgi:hypothetical protein